MTESSHSTTTRAAVLLAGLLVLSAVAGPSLATLAAAETSQDLTCSAELDRPVTANQVGTTSRYAIDNVVYAKDELVVYEHTEILDDDDAGFFTATSLDRDKTDTVRIDKRYDDAEIHSAGDLVVIVGQTEDGGTIHFLNASVGVSSLTSFDTGSTGGFSGMTVNDDEVAVQWRSKVVMYPLDGGEPRTVTVEKSDSRFPPLATYESIDGVHVLQTEETDVPDCPSGPSGCEYTVEQTTTRAYDDDLNLLWERTYDGDSYVNSAGGVLFTAYDGTVYRVDPQTGDRERVDGVTGSFGPIHYFQSTGEFYMNYGDSVSVVVDAEVREQFPGSQWHERSVGGETYFIRNSSAGVTVYDASGETVDSYNSLTAIPSPAESEDWSPPMPIPLAVDRVGVDVGHPDSKIVVVDENGTLAATDETQAVSQHSQYDATSDYLLQIRSSYGTRYAVKDIDGDCVASFDRFQLRNPLQGNISTVVEPKHVFAAGGEFYVQTDDGDLFRVSGFDEYANESDEGDTQTAANTTETTSMGEDTDTAATPTSGDRDAGTDTSGPGFSVLVAVLSIAIVVALGYHKS